MELHLILVFVNRLNSMQFWGIFVEMKYKSCMYSSEFNEYDEMIYYQTSLNDVTNDATKWMGKTMRSMCK